MDRWTPAPAQVLGPAVRSVDTFKFGALAEVRRGEATISLLRAAGSVLCPWTWSHSCTHLRPTGYDVRIAPDHGICGADHVLRSRYIAKA
jgi:hypothetical protein